MNITYYKYNRGFVFFPIKFLRIVLIFCGEFLTENNGYKLVLKTANIWFDRSYSSVKFFILISKIEFRSNLARRVDVFIKNYYNSHYAKN